MRLRRAWGLPSQSSGWLSSRLFDLTRAFASSGYIDDGSWADLELPRVFSLMNTTVSPIGGQCLYRQLRVYEKDAATLAQRYRTSTELQRNTEVREQLQLILSRLEGDSTAHLIDGLMGPPPGRPKHPRLLVLWGCVSLAVLIATFALSLPWLWWVWGGVLAINVVVLFIASPKLDADIAALLNCRRLLGVASRLSSHRFSGVLPEASELEATRAIRLELDRETRWLATVAPQGLLLDSLAHAFIYAANVCFFAKWIAYAGCVDGFTRHRPQWLRLFELIGMIDAAIAVANFLHQHPNHCAPLLTEAPQVALRDAYHPLMSVPVPNSVVLEGRSALISGSNMTGKTAFMKVVGVNVVFAQTLGLCLARDATLRRSPVMASIRGEQGIEDGKSRYLAEIQRILEFLQQAAQGHCGIFIIDEIFSGTNTIERIAAAKAVLDALSRDAQVLATTHDVELQALLSERFELLHFREDPAVEGFFDYKLRVGANTERNAIRLLERVGFPPAIITEALRLAGDDAHRVSSAAPRSPSTPVS